MRVVWSFVLTHLKWLLVFPGCRFACAELQQWLQSLAGYQESGAVATGRKGEKWDGTSSTTSTWKVERGQRGRKRLCGLGPFYLSQSWMLWLHIGTVSGVLLPLMLRTMNFTLSTRWHSCMLGRIFLLGKWGDKNFRISFLFEKSKSYPSKPWVLFVWDLLMWLDSWVLNQLYNKLWVVPTLCRSHSPCNRLILFNLYEYEASW